MILSLELKYFRRHESLTVAFANGLNAIRGANEKGKSSLIEAVLYALYGSKALRDSLTETVTWGHKESALSVKLVMRARDVMYQFSRSKNGAECKGDDGTMVTGQAEVSAFAAELLGADVKVASLLMLASQSGLRGALDDGPAAVSGLMAKLADFDLVDKILENAAQRLSLGAVAPIQMKLAQAQADLEALRLTVPDDAQYQVDKAALQRASLDLETLAAQEAERLDAVTKASDAVDVAEENNRTHDRAANNVATLVSQIESETSKLGVAEKAAATRPDDDAVAAAVQADADERAWTTRAAKHAKFLALAPYPESSWDGNWDSFNAELLTARTTAGASAQLVALARTDIAAQKARRITSGKCPTCGHAANSDEHVAAHNAEVDALIAALEPDLVAVQAAQKAADEYLRDLVAVENAARRYEAALPAADADIVIQRDSVPARAVWVGTVPAGRPDGSAGRALAAIREAERLAERAAGQVEAHRNSLADLQRRHGIAVSVLAGLPKVDLTPLKAAHSEAYAKYAEVANTTRLQREQADLCRKRVADYELQLATHTQKVASLTTRVAEYEDDIKRTEFNNTLVAKLKKIKPAITDHLWNITLGAVSVFFSQMRGEQSVVTKTPQGFRVNGQSADSLSGSTLDILALAVRVALTRTFIPHASFVILDEPAHGADLDRTGNILGFLSGCGFQQTILASHDILGETIADNVVTLGE